MAGFDHLAAVKRVTVKREQAERIWRQTIIGAVNEGHSLRKVAEVAGVTHTRVHQIVNGK